jgi:hypothetical protein
MSKKSTVLMISKYRWTDKMIGWSMIFIVEVTQWVIIYLQCADLFPVTKLRIIDCYCPDSKDFTRPDDIHKFYYQIRFQVAFADFYTDFSNFFESISDTQQSWKYGTSIRA